MQPCTQHAPLPAGLTAEAAQWPLAAAIINDLVPLLPCCTVEARRYGLVRLVSRAACVQLGGAARLRSAASACVRSCLLRVLCQTLPAVLCRRSWAVSPAPRQCWPLSAPARSSFWRPTPIRRP